jgi:CheY-like chemotaxis protein
MLELLLVGGGIAIGAGYFIYDQHLSKKEAARLAELRAQRDKRRKKSELTRRQHEQDLDASLKKPLVIQPAPEAGNPTDPSKVTLPTQDKQLDGNTSWYELPPTAPPEPVSFLNEPSPPAMPIRPALAERIQDPQPDSIVEEKRDEQPSAASHASDAQTDHTTQDFNNETPSSQEHVRSLDDTQTPVLNPASSDTSPATIVNDEVEPPPSHAKVLADLLNVLDDNTHDDAQSTPAVITPSTPSPPQLPTFEKDEFEDAALPLALPAIVDVNVDTEKTTLVSTNKLPADTHLEASHSPRPIDVQASHETLSPDTNDVALDAKTLAPFSAGHHPPPTNADTSDNAETNQSTSEQNNDDAPSNNSEARTHTVDDDDFHLPHIHVGHELHPSVDAHTQTDAPSNDDLVTTDDRFPDTYAAPDAAHTQHFESAQDIGHMSGGEQPAPTQTTLIDEQEPLKHTSYSMDADFTVYHPKVSDDVYTPLVLIVDDSQYIAKRLTQLSHAQGCRVIVALNGVQALKILYEYHDSPIDLVVSDMEMPHCTGLDLFLEMQKRTDTKDIPFVIFSGNLENIQKAKDKGVKHSLIKPFNHTHISKLFPLVLPRKASTTA